MATISKVTQNGVTVYPQTITAAIADASRKKALPDVLDAIEDDSQLQQDTTADAAIGKIPVGAKYSAGTSISSIISDALSYQMPIFQQLLINDGTNNYTSNTNVFCNSTPIMLAFIKYIVSNPSYVKDGNLTLNINGTTSTISTSTSGAQMTVSGTFIRAVNKSSFYVSLDGTTSLSAPMTQKKVVLTAYMPVYCFISSAQDETTVTNAFSNATAETTVYTGTHSIVKTGTFVKGGAWCVALPSHLGMTGIGTEADFGFGTQKTSTTTYSVTKNVNGISSVPYTIYMLPIDTAQTNLSVKIITKAK